MYPVSKYIALRRPYKTAPYVVVGQGLRIRLLSPDEINQFHEHVDGCRARGPSRPIPLQVPA